MRLKAVRVRTRGDVEAALAGTDREMLIDTCGTGGDATGTFNVSTAHALTARAGQIEANPIGQAVESNRIAPDRQVGRSHHLGVGE